MKAYVWDLDGTLLDSYGIIVPSLVAACGELGIKLDRAEVSRYVIRYSVNQLIGELAEGHGISAERIKSRYSDISDSMNKDMQAIPNAVQTLEALKLQGARHFVFTHRGTSSEFVLKNLNMYGYFDEIITSKSGFPRKPAPDGVLYLIEKYGLNPNETYYVGDRNLDIQCAVNAGIKGILYLPDTSLCTPDGSEDRVVSDLLDIAELS